MGTVLNKQTGRRFAISGESRLDTVMAFVSITYLLFMLLLTLWLLFDIWYTARSLVDRLGYADLDKLRTSSTIQLIAYTVVGGILGGTVNGIRSFVVWHCDRHAFGQRYVWKYVTDPWLGAALALFVFALVQSSVALIGGEIAPGSIGATQMTAMFGVGVLAGYGSRSVFIWLDAQVNRLFRVDGEQLVELPALTGKSQPDAVAELANVGLVLGTVTPRAGTDPALIGKVVEQTPPAATMVAKASAVDIVIGA